MNLRSLKQSLGRLKDSLAGLKESLGWLYYQYQLITGIYVLEPWEQSIFSGVLFGVVAMVIYTAYVFVPVHMHLALQFFTGLGGRAESTVALMN